MNRVYFRFVRRGFRIDSRGGGGKEKEGREERRDGGIFSRIGNGISWERRWRKVATGMEEEKYETDR